MLIYQYELLSFIYKNLSIMLLGTIYIQVIAIFNQFLHYESFLE